MLSHLPSWPTGLRVALAVIVLATVVGLLQAGAILLGTLAASVHNVVYVGVSLLAYFAALAAAAAGRRKGFFWNGLAVAGLHLVFAGRFLFSTARLILDLQVSPFPLSRFELWNLCVFGLALLLAIYLLAVERPRLLPRG